MITALAVASTFCPVLLVSIRYNDSGVMIRIWGGFLTILCLSRWEVSPVRIPTDITSFAPIPSRGRFKFSRISAANDLSGET